MPQAKRKTTTRAAPAGPEPRHPKQKQKTETDALRRFLFDTEVDIRETGRLLEALHMMSFDDLLHEDARGAIQAVVEIGIERWQRVRAAWLKATRRKVEAAAA